MRTNMSTPSVVPDLVSLADPKYRKFAAGLLPGTQNILGVRLPQLRRLAKEFAKGDWRSYLAAASDTTFEEIMLQGMVIGYADGKPEEMFGYIAAFVPKIDNWSVCDSFCAGLKITKQYPEEMWRFLQDYLKSDQEFAVRFGVVMTLWYFIDEDHLNEIFEIFDTIHHDGHYVKTAVAWAVSACYVKMPEKTTQYLAFCRLDEETYTKALQKIIESRCIDQETRTCIRRLQAQKSSRKTLDTVCRDPEPEKMQTLQFYRIRGHTK